MGGDLLDDERDAAETITVQQAELERAMKRALKSALRESQPPTPPRPSLPVRVARKGSKWGAYLLAGLVALGQIAAVVASPEYRGPIVQALKVLAVVAADALDEDPDEPPVLDATPMMRRKLLAPDAGP
jgi:hypothetical protein